MLDRTLNPLASFESKFAPQGTPITGRSILGLPPNQSFSTGAPPPYVPQVSQSTKAETPVETAFKNIINTGSVKPAMATLINPQTGDRQAVATGSQQAQALFGAGYVLEGSQGVPAAGAKSATTGTTFTGAETVPTGGIVADEQVEDKTQFIPQTKLDFLRASATKVRNEAFDIAYGHTPDEWQDLPPSVQRDLRQQRIQSLAAEYGNYTDAITQVKEESKTKKEDSILTLNFMMENGVLGSVSEQELSDLSSAAGIPLASMQAIAKKGERPEIKQLGDQLVTVMFDPVTGKYTVTPLYSPPKTGGSGAGKLGPGEIEMAEIGGKSYPAEFVKYYKTKIEPASGGPTFNYPGAPPGAAAAFDAQRVLEEFNKWSQPKADREDDVTRGVVASLIVDIENGLKLSELIPLYPEMTSSEIADYFKAHKPS